VTEGSPLHVSRAEGSHVMAVSEGQIEEGDTVTDTAYIAGGTG